MYIWGVVWRHACYSQEGAGPGQPHPVPAGDHARAPGRHGDVGRARASPKPSRGPRIWKRTALSHSVDDINPAWPHIHKYICTSIYTYLYMYKYIGIYLFIHMYFYVQLYFLRFGHMRFCRIYISNHQQQDPNQQPATMSRIASFMVRKLPSSQYCPHDFYSCLASGFPNHALHPCSQT